MDPQTTLRDLLDALGENDWHRVTACSNALLQWMDAGGFPPTTLGGRTLGTTWHRAVATFLCRSAIERADAAKKSRTQKEGA